MLISGRGMIRFRYICIYMMSTHGIHVFELRVETNLYDLSSFKCNLRNSERGLKNSGLNFFRPLSPLLK